MTQPHLRPAFALALALPLALAAPARAADEAECTAAIETTQRDLANDPAAQNRPEGAGGAVANLLAQAGEAGLQGRYEECLQLVRDARGSAGLRVE